jgi:hypothetical protein
LLQTKKIACSQFHAKLQQDIVGMIPVDLNLADFKYPGNVLNPIQVGMWSFCSNSLWIRTRRLVESWNQSWWMAAFIHVFEPFADEQDAPLYRHNGTGKTVLVILLSSMIVLLSEKWDKK